MTTVYYDSASLYIEQATTLRGKITAIENIINGLLSTAATAAANDHITEYSLDDGQTKIRAVYRSVREIEASIQSFERLKQLYVNRLNGRVTRLVDGKNFNG